MEYYQIPSLSDVYLEGSYVLAIHEYDDRVVFDLEAVLREGHPSYEQPEEENQYCYRKAPLVFRDVNSVKWIEKTLTPFSDAAGEIDYGNIDSFTKDNGCYSLRGDWGDLKICCGSIEFALVG